MRKSLPMYKARTLFKDVLEACPNIIDFNLPSLEGLIDETAVNLKHYLFDTLSRHYKYSEIGTYYAYDFINYFQDRWYTKIVKYVPLLKAKLKTEDNINTGEDFTANKNVTSEDKAGKTVTETYSREQDDSTKYGRTIENTIENTNNRKDSIETTTSNTTKNSRSEGITEDRNETNTRQGNATNTTDVNANTTQYERQLTESTNSTENTTQNNETTTIDSNNSHNATIIEDNTDSRNEDINSTIESTQNGNYNTTYGGTDNTTISRTDNRNIRNSGSDTQTLTESQNYQRLIYDYGRITAMISSPDIVDDFIGEFSNLFMEVFI